MLLLSRSLLWHARTIPVPSPNARLTSITTRFFSLSAIRHSKDAPSDSRPVVISGPSGSGKSTLISKLFYEYPSTFGFSVSHTTRLPRPGEQDGIAYHFISPSTMSELISQQDPRFFLEHAVFSGNHYGTSKKAVQDVINSGKICILDIDLQGVRSVRESGLDARYVFVRPRGLEVLERRLRGRGTETEEAIRKRLEIARAEWTEGLEGGMFDCVVVNGELEEAYRDLRDYIFSPRRS